jgi:hypothetical protein
MEKLLFLWDELDDWMGVVRHQLLHRAHGLAGFAAPLATASSAVSVWFLLPQYRLFALLLGLTASVWAALRPGA